MRYTGLLVLFCSIISITFLRCNSNNYYRDLTPEKSSYFLYSLTKTPWGGINCSEKIVELMDNGANLEYTGLKNKPTKSTPFLNAAGALECLKGKSKRRSGEIDSMEIEAVKIVKFLAKKGANIHATSTSRKLNALHLAACGGREKMIPVLVELGLDINSRDSTKGYGNTPLIHAIGAGDLATIKAIIKAGADINLSSFDGNSPLDYAIAYSRSKEHLWLVPYRDQEAIAEYLQSIGAKHGKNQFKGMLYFDENKK